MSKKGKEEPTFVESIPFGSGEHDYDEEWDSIYGEEDEEDQALDAELKARFDKLSLKKKADK